jgi:DNA-binding response OmpR family regulator
VKLLIVEDEDRVASFLVKGLRAQGYGVTWVSSGREALRCAVEPDISLVILDLGLPDLDGFDVLERLRERGATVPVLVLSARAFVGHPRQVLSRPELLSLAWGTDFDPGTNLVDVYVGYLRRKLGESAIETVRGAGYRLRIDGPGPPPRQRPPGWPQPGWPHAGEPHAGEPHRTGPPS